MGLFTNRKRNDEDVEGLSEAASMLAQFKTPPAPDLAEFTPPDLEISSDQRVDTLPSPSVPDFFPAGPISDFSPSDPIDESSAAPLTSFEPIEIPGAAAEEPEPRRRLQDRPRAQAGNVEIDATGLLELLGVEVDSDLIDISEAHQRFLSDHEPSDADDSDAAGIKEKIRCEVNTAYASFRLTRTT